MSALGYFFYVSFFYFYACLATLDIFAMATLFWNLTLTELLGSFCLLLLIVLLLCFLGFSTFFNVIDWVTICLGFLLFLVFIFSIAILILCNRALLLLTGLIYLAITGLLAIILCFRLLSSLCWLFAGLWIDLVWVLAMLMLGMLCYGSKCQLLIKLTIKLSTTHFQMHTLTKHNLLILYITLHLANRKYNQKCYFPSFSLKYINNPSICYYPDMIYILERSIQYYCFYNCRTILSPCTSISPPTPPSSTTNPNTTNAPPPRPARAPLQKQEQPKKCSRLPLTPKDTVVLRKLHQKHRKRSNWADHLRINKHFLWPVLLNYQEWLRVVIHKSTVILVSNSQRKKRVRIWRGWSCWIVRGGLCKVTRLPLCNWGAEIGRLRSSWWRRGRRSVFWREVGTRVSDKYYHNIGILSVLFIVNRQ